MRNLLFIIIVLLVASCNPNARDPKVVELVPAPYFNADSAYAFIEQQIDFGPRVPGTIGHKMCGDFIVAHLKKNGFTVVEQIDSIVGFDSREFPLRNIIGSLNPEKSDRVMLCAHWDSRPYMDQDQEHLHDSLIGANDNASGVSILLEIARIMAKNNPKIGVDLTFFDMEDQGRPVFEVGANPEDHGYCLGSTYWSQNLKAAKPTFAILLDMVGAQNAVFTLESISMQHARDIMYKVWDMGTQLGYSTHYQYNKTRPIYDDHKYINEIAGIPCIDIIQHDGSTSSGFGTYWHTHQDNIELIDAATLNAVGHTLTQVVYNEPGS